MLRFTWKASVFFFAVSTVPAVIVAQDCPTKAPSTYGGSSFGRGDDDERQSMYWSPEDNQFTEIPACESAADNTRGYFNAHIAPCAFSFHSASETEDISTFHQTTICSDENQIGPDSVLDYATHWKDECVGDFARCYSVENDEDIFLDFVCKKRWKFPEGTTHISVNCKRDKTLKNLAAQKYRAQFQSDQNFQKELDNEEKLMDKEMRQREIAILIVLSFLSVLVLLCCYSAHRWFAVPYKQFLDSRNHQEEASLVSSSGNDSSSPTSPVV